MAAGDSEHARLAKAALLYGSNSRAKKPAISRFEIIPNPFLNNIEAQWIFLDTKSGGDNHVRSARLHIENRTSRVLRIATPGLHGSEVGLNGESIPTTRLNLTVRFAIGDARSR
jgi:hypothetical protein